MKSYKELLNEIYESGDSYKLLSKDSGSSSMLISEAFNSLKKSIVYVVATERSNVLSYPLWEERHLRIYRLICKSLANVLAGFMSLQAV